MRIVDVNVLLYAADRSSPQHDVSRRWLERAFYDQHVVGFAWNVILAFLRVSTNSRAFANTLTIDQAQRFVAQWLAKPTAVAVDPTPAHLVTVTKLLQEVGTAGDLVSDAHLAALAIEHDAEVVSFDRDFGRFSGIRWSVPRDEGSVSTDDRATPNAE